MGNGGNGEWGMRDAIQPLADSGNAVAVAIAVVESDNCFLIGQRPPGGNLAGCWEFPGGKVHAGEAAADAAVRECFEETGVGVEVLGSCGERLHAYDFGSVHLQFYACRPLDPSQQPRPPFRWVQRHNLSHHQFPPANEELLAVLQSRAADS